VIVSWNTTNRCNQFCSHCYRDAGEASENELSLEEGKALIDEIAKAEFKIMIFSGGEPLMVPWITDLVCHAVSKGLRPVFGSNGMLITAERAVELKQAGTMGIGISLDSLDPEAHDRFRSTPGAWKGAVEGMENCRKAGLPFQIHTTVMKWNQHEISAITDFAAEHGAVAHHTFFLIPTGRGESIENQALESDAYERVLQEIMAKQKTVSIELKPTCAPQFMRIAGEMGMRMRYSRGCLAGTHYCIISPKGDVQPCAYINQPIGNVRDIPFSEIWAESPVFKELRTMDYKGDCGSCSYKVACGGCRARAAYYAHGDVMAADPVCGFNQGGAVER